MEEPAADAPMVWSPCPRPPEGNSFKGCSPKLEMPTAELFIHVLRMELHNAVRRSTVRFEGIRVGILWGRGSGRVAVAGSPSAGPRGPSASTAAPACACGEPVAALRPSNSFSCNKDPEGSGRSDGILLGTRRRPSGTTTPSATPRRWPTVTSPRSGRWRSCWSTAVRTAATGPRTSFPLGT